MFSKHFSLLFYPLKYSINRKRQKKYKKSFNPSSSPLHPLLIHKPIAPHPPLCPPPPRYPPPSHCTNATSPQTAAPGMLGFLCCIRCKLCWMVSLICFLLFAINRSLLIPYFGQFEDTFHISLPQNHLLFIATIIQNSDNFILARHSHSIAKYSHNSHN